MSKKTGSKPRKQRQRPPLCLKIACPSCAAPVNDPCILLTAPGLKIPKKSERFAANTTLATPSPAPHASRVLAYETLMGKAAKPVNRTPRKAAAKRQPR